MPTTGAGRGRRTGRASMSPGNRRRLTPLPDELASPDEEQRRAFLAHFLQTAVPAAQGLWSSTASRTSRAAAARRTGRGRRPRSPTWRRRPSRPSRSASCGRAARACSAPWRNSSSGSASDCCPPASSTSSWRWSWRGSGPARPPLTRQLPAGLGGRAVTETRRRIGAFRHASCYGENVKIAGSCEKTLAIGEPERNTTTIGRHVCAGGQ